MSAKPRTLAQAMARTTIMQARAQMLLTALRTCSGLAAMGTPEVLAEIREESDEACRKFQHAIFGEAT